MAELSLGKKVEYSSSYDSSLLFPIPRAKGRDVLSIQGQIPFHGYDFWRGYELSWLNLKGKPEAALLLLVIDAATPNLIESKSLKLYLNSFSNTKIQSSEVASTITKDLEKVLRGSVSVALFPVTTSSIFDIAEPKGVLLDVLDIECSVYEVDETLLKMSDKKGSETIYSNLFRSNCPVTGQPDWATVVISYSGTVFDHRALLKYLVSYRNHVGFHENCCERIFIDLMNYGNPQELTVELFFTRRGGLDINPCRSTKHIQCLEPIRLVRQ